MRGPDVILGRTVRILGPMRSWVGGETMREGREGACWRCSEVLCFFPPQFPRSPLDDLFLTLSCALLWKKPRDVMNFEISEMAFFQCNLFAVVADCACYVDLMWFVLIELTVFRRGAWHGKEGGISGDNWNCKHGLQCNFKHWARKNGVWVAYVRDILNFGTFANEFCTLTLSCFSTISRLTINAVLFERFTAPSFLNMTIPFRTVVCQVAVLKDALKWLQFEISLVQMCWSGRAGKKQWKRGKESLGAAPCLVRHAADWETKFHWSAIMTGRDSALHCWSGNYKTKLVLLVRSRSFAQSQWSFGSDARERSKQTNTAFYRSVKVRQLTKNLAQKKVTQIWWGQGLNLEPPGWEAGILPLRQQTLHSLLDSSPLFHNQSVQCLHTLTPEKENCRI